MNDVDNPAPTIDEIENAILRYVDPTPPEDGGLSDEQVEHAAEVLGPVLFGGAAEPSAA